MHGSYKKIFTDAAITSSYMDETKVPSYSCILGELFRFFLEVTVAKNYKKCSSNTLMFIVHRYSRST